MARQSNGIRLEAIEKRIGNLEGSIARIEGALLGETGFLQTTNKKMESHDTEIKSLNKVRWQALGGAGAIAFLVSFLKGIFTGR